MELAGRLSLQSALAALDAVRRRGRGVAPLASVQPDANACPVHGEIRWVRQSADSDWFCVAVAVPIKAHALVKNREPDYHKLTARVRPLDSACSGNALGVRILLALAGDLLEQSVRGGVIIVGVVNAGGIEPVTSAVDAAKRAVDSGVQRS